MPLVTWLGLVVAAMFGTSDFLGGLLSRRMRLIHVLLGTQCTMLVLSLAGLALFPAAEGGPALGWGVLAGIAQAVGVAALFRGLAIGRMGVVAPISALAVLVPLGVGIARGDALTVVSGAGIAAAVIGSVLAGGPEFRPSPDARRSRASILLAFVAALGFGCSQVLLAQGSAVHVPSTLVATAGTALVLYAVAWPLMRVANGPRSAAASGPVPRRQRALSVLGPLTIGALNFGANAIFGFASTVAPLAILAVFAALYPLVTAALARGVLHERLRRIQIVGAILVIAGVVLIAAATIT